MTTLNELLAPDNLTALQAAFFSEMIALHKANGVPVDAWLSIVNVGLSQTEINALLFANERLAVSQLARAMFLEYASGDGLTLFARSQYSLERYLAQVTKGTIRLISAPTAPLYNFVPGQVTVGTTGATTSQKLYTNVTGGVLAPNSTLDLVFAAAEAGASYNIPNGTPLDLKTSFVGVTVSNPIYPPGFTWISQAGTDLESDDSLKQRCLARWGTIGAECNEEGILYWTFLAPAGYTASPVRFAKVLSNWTKSTTYTGYWPGLVSVVVGSDFGPLAPADLIAVRANFENPQKYGIGRQLFLIDMELLNVTVSADVFAFGAAGLTAQQIKDLVIASLVDFESFIDIGESIFPQKIGARIEDANKKVIRNVNMVTPTTVTIPLYYQKVKLNPGTINVILV